jgi:hypothetical protein
MKGALMTAAGHNLKRLLAKQGWGRRPLPSGAALAVAQPSECAIVCYVSAILLVESRYLQGTPGTTPGSHL